MAEGSAAPAGADGCQYLTRKPKRWLCGQNEGTHPNTVRIARSHEIFGIEVRRAKRTYRRPKTLIFCVHPNRARIPCEREWAPARVVALRLWLRPLPERRLRFTPFVPPFLAPINCELGEVPANLSKLTGPAQSRPGHCPCRSNNTRFETCSSASTQINGTLFVGPAWRMRRRLKAR